MPLSPMPSRLFVHMSGYVVASHVTMVRTDGYAIPGRGAAAYAFVEEGVPDSRSSGSGTRPVAGADRFQAADGRWFALAERMPDTFMFGGVGDGIHDDTLAIRAQHDYCVAHGLRVLLPMPPVSWRTTETIHSRAEGWRGLEPRTPWRFDPQAPESEDMRACLQLDEAARSIETIAFEGPHQYDVSQSATYVADPNQGPYSPDGGWYHGFLKPGCCAIKVSGNCQPIFKEVSTSARQPRSFKVGICLDSIAGHTTVGAGCDLHDLIGIRVIKNGDDLKLLDEPGFSHGLAGILFGTSDVNGTFNGGLGLRNGEIYVGGCPYGILQMHDHGPRGAALPNPHVPIAGLYGSLDGIFLEAIGEAGIQTLPTSVCADLTYTNIDRFSWADAFKLPNDLLQESRKQRAAFIFGQLSRNCRIGTNRSSPSYKSPFTKAPDACSIRINLLDADASTVIAQQLLTSTMFVDTAPSARLSDKFGRMLHEGNLVAHAAFATEGNLLLDPYALDSWTGNQPRITTAISDPIQDLQAELGRSTPVLTLPEPGTYSLAVRDAPNAALAKSLTYLSMWANVPAESHVLVRLKVQHAEPYRYTVTLHGTDGWQRVVLGGNSELGAAAVSFEFIVLQGSAEFAGPMLSTGQLRPFTRLTGPGSYDRLHARGGLEIHGDLAIVTDTPSGKSVATISAPTFSTRPAGYLMVLIDGVSRHIPYY